MFRIPSDIRLICDLQFGSTGKGLIAGYLAEKHNPDTLVTAWSPNAGHTYINDQGRKWVHTMVPNGIVSEDLQRIMIGPGAIINLNNLIKELKDSADILQGVEVLIHGNASMVFERHRNEEAGPMTKIGSTKKGCGASMIEKIRRDPEGKITAAQNASLIYEAFDDLTLMDDIQVSVVQNSYLWVQALSYSNIMHIEGAQGYSLGINSGFYPYTTSRECTPAQICIDCGVPVHWPMLKIGCLRTYPIRVANRYDDNGDMVGWSGPGYPDQQEIAWDYIGVPEEHTTVTQLPRRVFKFSKMQLMDAVANTGVDDLFLNFVNYLKEPDPTTDTPKNRDRVYIEECITEAMQTFGCRIKYIGNGPTVEYIHTL